MTGDQVHIRKHGAAVVREPIAKDWRWLDDVAGNFSDDFFAAGRSQPPPPPDRDMGPTFA